MRSRAAAALSLVGLAGACARPEPSSTPPTIVNHPIRVDSSRKLLSWSAEDAPYAHVSRLAWTALETRFPPQDNGLETWLAFSRFDPETGEGINWPHNPAGLYAMIVDSALLWYSFSGDDAAIALARKALDHQLDHGTTPADWEWARVPFASANPGDVEYGGADDEWCEFCGRGDGAGVVEPDKIGEAGVAYARMFEATGDVRYRDAAVACADALARHVREGDESASPWPFRVNARTGVAREEYSANVVGAIELFDELRRLGVRDDAHDAHDAHARAIALDWLLRVPMRNDAWSGYFEDIDIQSDPACNPNQYVALRTASWLMRHPDDDPEWRDHAAHLLAWSADTFGGDTATERGTQWGATVMSEQAADVAKMGSHTARYGATLAAWFETTGDASAKERAFRSLNWATYTCADDGIVAVGEDKNEGWWFSDGYGDYVRHFLAAMGAVPEWAPARENHLLRSTSVVTHVEYAGARVGWTTFDDDAIDVLRLVARPERVARGDVQLAQREDLDDEGYVVDETAGGGAVVRVRHRGADEMVVEVRDTATVTGTVTATGTEAPRADGCAVGPGQGGGEGGKGIVGGGLFVLVGRRWLRGRKSSRTPR